MAVWRYGISPAEALHISAIFIMLSGCMAEARQCYWCGPLAEQVHRSQRAPPCAPTAAHLTICEPNLDYCAVVATSPPYVESRYCVKLYQDECYPLFCNSTRTWKMTCPCRGDLCNGPNTERENEAFAALGKLVAKTHANSKKRSKRAPTDFIKKLEKKIISPEGEEEIQVNTVGGANTQTDLVTAITESVTVATEAPKIESTIKDEQDKQSTAMKVETSNKHSLSPAKQEEINIKDMMTTSDQAMMTTAKPEDIEVQETLTTLHVETQNEATLNTADNVVVLRDEKTAAKKDEQSSFSMIELDINQPHPSSIDRLHPYTDNIELQADDPRVGLDKVHDEKNENKKMENETTKTIQTEPSKGTKSDVTLMMNSATDATVASNIKPTNDKLKPSEEPTAEAFQQDNSPVNKKVGKPLNAPQNVMSTTEKAIEHTTIAQTTTSTLITEKVASKSTLAPKNTTKNIAEIKKICILTIIICILANVL